MNTDNDQGAEATSGNVLRTLKTIGGLALIAVLLVILWPIMKPMVIGTFDNVTKPGTGLKNGVYDFTQEVTSDAPIGPVEEVTVTVPDGFAQAVPGYTDGNFLESVTLSNVQHLSTKPNAAKSTASLCSVDVALVWAEGAKERGLIDPHKVLVRDTGRGATIEELSGEAQPDVFAEFSEDWSTATAQVACAPPVDFDPQRGGFEIVFDYIVPVADGTSETRRMALAPIRVTDNGKLFVAQLRNGMSQEVPNAIAGTYLGANQWGESYGEYGTGEPSQEGGSGIA